MKFRILKNDGTYTDVERTMDEYHDHIHDVEVGLQTQEIWTPLKEGNG